MCMQSCKIPVCQHVPIQTRVVSDQHVVSVSVSVQGVRLGWTVVPKALKYGDGSSVHADWNRVMSTCFNGASNIVQAGGLACLQVSAHARCSEWPCGCGSG